MGLLLVGQNNLIYRARRKRFNRVRRFPSGLVTGFDTGAIHHLPELYR